MIQNISWFYCNRLSGAGVENNITSAFKEYHLDYLFAND